MSVSVKILFFVVSIFFYSLLFVSISNAQSNDVIRVSGYSGNRFPLTSVSGSSPHPISETSRLYTFLQNPEYFGPNGVSPCYIHFNPLVDSIEPNSLVGEDGELKVEVFFSGINLNSPSSDEISEIHRFLEAGGVFYLNGNIFDVSWFGHGYEYNPLFQSLGLEDTFSNQRISPAGQDSQSNFVEIESPLTSGPFGQVRNISYDSYFVFNNVNMNGIVADNTNTHYLLNELAFNKGYLVVAAAPFYMNNRIDNLDNREYYMNLFALACDKKQDNSVILDVPSFKQGLAPYDDESPNWETHIYDHGNELDLWCDTNRDYASMAECGCAISSAAMVTNYHGVKSASGGFLEVNPFSLNLYAKEFFPTETNGVKGFFGGNFNWHFIDNFTALVADENNNQKVEFASREDFNVERIKQLIDDDKPVIVNVLGQWGEHWVVVKGYDPDTNRLIINDPATEDPIIGKYSYLDELYTPKLNKSMIIYQKTNSDFRRIQFVSSSKNNILVTDSLGNKTGYDPAINSIVESIPNSSYALDNFYGDPTNPDQSELSTDGIYFLTVELPEDSEYKLQIMSRDGDLHPVQVYTSDIEGALAGKIITLDKPVENYTFIYDEETAGEEVIGEVEIETIEVGIEVEPLIKSNIIIPHKLFPVPVAVLSSNTFDRSKVDKPSITFGKTGDEKSLIGCAKVLVDVNRDKKKDLICYFYGDKLGLDVSDKKVFLKGKYEETIFVGEDNVNVWKPWLLF